MRTDKVVLTKEEAGWFARNVLKIIALLEASEARNPGVKDRSTYKGLVSMQSRAEQMKNVVDDLEDHPYEIETSLVRRQRKLIADLVGSQVKILREKTIPLYERRGESHKSYLLNAQEKLEMLSRMRKKFT